MDVITFTKRLMWIFVALLFASSMLGCGSTTDEIPVTTVSEEAYAHFLHARELYEQLRIEESRERFDQALELDSEFALAHFYRSRASISDADRRTYLEKAVDFADDVSKGERILILQEQAYYLDTDLGKQHDLRMELVEKYPNDKRAHNLMGLAYYYRDEDAKAITEFEAAIALDKYFPPPYNMLGYAYSEIGEYDRAEQTFRDYIGLIPGEPNPYDSMAEMYLKTGRFEESIDYYQRAFVRDSAFTSAKKGIGVCLVMLGRYDDGREAFTTAMDLELSDWGRLSDLDLILRSYLYQGDYAGAVTVADELLEAAENAELPTWIPSTHNIKTRIYHEMGDFNSAEQASANFHQSMEGADFSPSTMNWLARNQLFVEAQMNAKRQDFEAAQKLAEEYKELLLAREDPRVDENYNGLLGMIRYERGEYETATEIFKQSNQENPYTSYYHGVALSKAGYEDLAQELFKRTANWNDDSYDYAFIRDRAFTAIVE